MLLLAEKIIWSAIVVFLYKPFINFAVKTDIILKNKINTIIMKKLFLLSLSVIFALSVFAQWDDVYYNPKKKDPTAVRTQSARGRSTYKNQSSDEGLYEKQIRDANDKNRVTVIDRTVDNVLELPNGVYGVEVDGYTVRFIDGEYDDMTNVYDLPDGYYTIDVNGSTVTIKRLNISYYTRSRYDWDWSYPYRWSWGWDYDYYWHYPTWYWHSSRFYWDNPYYFGYGWYWTYPYYYNNWWHYGGGYTSSSHYYSDIQDQAARRRDGSYLTSSSGNYRRYQADTQISSYRSDAGNRGSYVRSGRRADDTRRSSDWSNDRLTRDRCTTVTTDNSTSRGRRVVVNTDNISRDRRSTTSDGSGRESSTYTRDSRSTT
ncbi:MAG: hypothetical protein D8B59_12380, partial [Bacteroidetes bacterium]